MVETHQLLRHFGLNPPCLESPWFCHRSPWLTSSQPFAHGGVPRSALHVTWTKPRVLGTTKYGSTTIMLIIEYIYIIYYIYNIIYIYIIHIIHIHIIHTQCFAEIGHPLTQLLAREIHQSNLNYYYCDCRLFEAVCLLHGCTSSPHNPHESQSENWVPAVSHPKFTKN
jgi:hypothetical protein